MNAPAAPPFRSLAASLAALAALAGCGAPQPALEPDQLAAEEHLLTLTNGEVVVGLLPAVGGRVVVYRDAAGANLLFADPDTWAGPHPEPAVETPWKAYNGHIVWIGPQGEWWTHTDLAPERKRRHAGWPPDPFLVFGRFTVVERSAAHAVLQGPPSPVTGLQLTKTVRLLGGRKVELTVSAVNRRDEPVAWDLWSNTRVSNDVPAFVPVRPERGFRFEFRTGDVIHRGMFPWEVTDGWFHFDADARPVPPVKALASKAFIAPAEGLIATFRGPYCFAKRAEAPPDGSVHPDQAFVEIWCQRDDAGGGFQEMEMHGPYRMLAPGESMSFTETWDILDYAGPPTPRARTAFLEGRFAIDRTVPPKD